MEVKAKESGQLDDSKKKTILTKIINDFEEDDDNVFDKSILFHSLIESDEQEKPNTVSSEVQTIPKKDPGGSKKRKFFKKGSNTHDVSFKPYPYNNNQLDDDLIPKTTSNTTVFDGGESVNEKRVKIGAVKSYHEMLEIGEFEEFNYDIRYAVDGIQSQLMSIRCLSILNLAKKCLIPSFRMHLRAYGNLSKIFKMIDDSKKDLRISLCTATALFVLSQDNLNTDLDENYLKLLINLLNTKSEVVDDEKATDLCLKNTYEKVIDICRGMQSQGYGQLLDLNNLTPNQIAAEILLTIGGKKINDWFKNDVRKLGGFEPILVYMQNSLTNVPDKLRDSPKFVRSSLRFVKLLENLTYTNCENSTYVYEFNNGIMIEILFQLFYQSSYEIITETNNAIDASTVLLRDLILLSLKVIINLKECFNEENFAYKLDKFKHNFISHCLQFLFDEKGFIVDSKRFEMNILVLILLINLVEKNHSNKLKLVNDCIVYSRNNIADGQSTSKSGLEALIEQFYFWEKCTQEAETNTKDFLSGKTTSASLSHASRTSNDQIIEETLSQLLQRAGLHMEFTFLCAFVSILLGFLMLDDEQLSTNVVLMLRDNSVEPLISMLQKFYDFIKVTGVSHLQHMNEMYFKTTEKILEHFYKYRVTSKN